MLLGEAIYSSNANERQNCKYKIIPICVTSGLIMYFHTIEKYAILKMNELQLCVTEVLGVRFLDRQTDSERAPG